MHLLSLKNLNQEQLLKLIDKGIEIKKNPEKYRDSLEKKSLAMIFQKTSTRTRVSFEVAMTQLGGHALYIDWRTTNFGLSDISDETQYLSRNVNCIMARLLRNKDLERMADASLVPIVNGCDEKHHPSQAIADLITMKEKKGKLRDTKLVYVGIHNNVCNSLIEGCTKTGVRITTVTPIFNEPSRDEELLRAARETGLYETTMDVNAAIQDADFVYTDTWIDMEFFTNQKYITEREKRMKIMMPYQINRELLGNSQAYVMHDMPIHRGYEIDPDIIESKKSIIYQQSENRLFSAKAILLKILENQGNVAS